MVKKPTVTAILWLILISFGLITPANSQQNISRQTEGLETINRIEKIRIKIEGGRANGYGHLSMGLTVMERLRNLGFNGKFEVIFSDEGLQKLADMLPELSKLTTRQIVPQLNAEFISDSYFLRHKKEFEQVSLAVVGAADYGVPNNLKARTLIVVQPYLWDYSIPPSVNGESMAKFNEMPISLDLKENDPIPQLLLEKHQERQLVQKLLALKEVSASRDRFEIAPAYGLSAYSGTDKLLRLINSIERVYQDHPGVLKKRTVFTVFSSLDKVSLDSWVANDKQGKRLFLDATKPGAIDKIRNAPPESVIVPKPCLNIFFRLLHCLPLWLAQVL
jgi:hypothetical protein